MANSQPDKSQGPKTALDEKFLSTAAQVMMRHGIKSDRGISAALGKHPDFINRIRRGLQSAPADAWDVLFDKYPEARSITNITITAEDGGPAIGNVEGDVSTAPPTNLKDCQGELAAARVEVETLRIQLAAKEEVIAAKNALIESQNVNLSLLRGGQSRLN